ncbi:MAG TPA: hypothetical protein EYQ36_08465, partial [Sulfitobacter sp.]|nr:hypothetical protein [Sulfitobacter sp.]
MEKPLNDLRDRGATVHVATPDGNEIKGWDDLERRLALDRRCYAYFHPHMAGEPLIFVEVA